MMVISEIDDYIHGVIFLYTLLSVLASIQDTETIIRHDTFH